MNLVGIERARIVTTLERGVAEAEALIARLAAEATAGRALIEELRSETPPPLEEVLERGRRLKLPLWRSRESELAEPPRESGVSLSARGVILAMRGSR